MKTLEKMCFKSTLLLFCLFFLSFNFKFSLTESKLNAVSIKDALNNQMISCVLKSKGGHQENCMDIELKNLTSDRIVVKLESGRNLISSDSASQNIIVVKEELFVLHPSQKQQKDVYGFCAQSYKKSPTAGTTYFVGDMFKKEIVWLTQHLAKNKYPASAMQDAIWTMTNNRPTASIFHANRDSIKDLQDFIAQLKNDMPPWYSIEYTNPEGELTSDVAKSIHGVLERKLPNNTVIKLVVYDKFNIPQLRTEFLTSNCRANHPFQINVLSLPKGRYYLGIYTLGGRLDERVFSI